MFKLTTLLVFVFTCVMHSQPDTKDYVLNNAKKLEQLIAKKKITKAPFDLSEMFSEHVEDVNKLLTDLNDDNFESSKNEDAKQEVVNQIAQHMEILQKLISIMSDNSPREELNRFCNSSSGPFHDAICNRPAKKLKRKLVDDESAQEKKKRRIDDLSLMQRKTKQDSDNDLEHP